MTEDQKRKFFNERIQRDALEVDHFNFLDTKDEILFMLLSTWPWQKLFIPVVKDIIQYHDDNSDMQCEFLDAITDRMLEDHYLGYPLNMSKYRDLLHEVWLMIPESVKRTMEPVTFGYDFVSNLINMWDLNSLKLILNDPATAVCRNELIELGMHSYDELIMKNQFEQLDEFADEMFQTEEEKQIFKKKRDALMKLISTGQFDLIDKFLDWQGSTLEEKQLEIRHR
ncbi:uncharacterized protein [Chelonus insularis]|uniref:uncharacterized protein n=1 Tax=Chelonus insularis TaxID=460826 RepID=UPI00158A9122|nr:uncharacterized protein LOC118072857 [Chelonus insularis]